MTTETVPEYRQLASLILEEFAEISPRIGGLWDDGATSPASIFVTHTGVWISILHPSVQEPVGEYHDEEFSFGIRIAYPATGAVLLEAEYDRLPVSSNRFTEVRHSILDAIAAAEAGATPGLETLYVARATDRREKIAENLREMEARNAQRRQRQSQLREVLGGMGINPPTAVWGMSDAGWHFDGAVVFLEKRGPYEVLRVWIEDVNDMPEYWEDPPKSVAIVDLDRNGRTSAYDRAKLLDAILRAQEAYREQVKWQLAEPVDELAEPVDELADSTSPASPHYVVKAFYNAAALQEWLNEMHEKGYDNPQITYSVASEDVGGGFAIMSLPTVINITA